MGVKSKHSAATMAHTVGRYVMGESVKKLAGELGMSVPAVYLWIIRATKDAVDGAKGKHQETLMELRLKSRMQDNEISMLHSIILNLQAV